MSGRTTAGRLYPAGLTVSVLIAVALIGAGCTGTRVDTTPLDTATRTRIERFLGADDPTALAPWAAGDAPHSLHTVLFEPAGSMPVPSDPRSPASADTASRIGDRYVYGDVLESWWTLNVSDGVVVGVSEGSGSAYPARILMRPVGGVLQPVAMDAPADGSYAQDVERLFPRRVRALLDDAGRAALFAREADTVCAWVEPQLDPGRLVVVAPPADLRDPHEHAERVYERLSLAPGYAGVAFSALPSRRPEGKDWELAGDSPRGTYRAYYDLSGGTGLVIERVADGCLTGVNGGIGLAQMFPATWKDDRTLCVDRVDVASDSVRSLTHIEIDAGTLQVLRAVPLGPLGFGGPIPR